MANIYLKVIEDVINKVRDDFINNDGPGEAILNELQGLWEQKMMQAGAISGPITRSVPQSNPTPVHDLNVPYEGTEEYETPTADMLFPPTPLPGSGQTPLPGVGQTPLPGTDGSPYYNIPTGGTPITPNRYSPAVENGGVPGMRGGRGMPSPYMQQQPSTWLNQRAPLDVNVAYTEAREQGEQGPTNQPTTQDFFATPAGKRKREDFRPPYQAGRYNIPQQDGAGDFQVEMFKADTTLLYGKVERGGQVGKSSSSKIPQLDGPPPDPYDDDLSTPNDFFATPAGKRKREDFRPPYQAGRYNIPQQDGAGDFQVEMFKADTTLLYGKVERGGQVGKSSSSKIPQLDGPPPDPYDDDLSTPNIYNYQVGANEDYNAVNTPMPNELQTPAHVPTETADDDDEPLNEDDDDDLDDVEDGEDLNTTHLVLAQFDKVTRTKSRWKCSLKNGIMHINNKDILFNKATGEFDF